MRYVNPHNVEWLIPGWAIHPYALAKDMDTVLSDYFATYPYKGWEKPLGCWIDVRFDGDGGTMKLKLPETEEDNLRLGQLAINKDGVGVAVPINSMLKGSPAASGSHSLYVHGFESELPLLYFGITRRPWYERLAEHRRSAANGSPYLFHRAMREHSEKKIMHRVIAAHLTHDQAMEQEESYVGQLSLYPLGLNMIPGGFAGIRYLHHLGITARTSAERDTEIEALARRPSIDGRPNPLCAARWETDPNFAERVICGHSGRLTADQVRTIRMMAVAGRSLPTIAQHIGDHEARVQRVLSGKRYGRIR